ncbi:hypothetical protein DEU56DRAFT_870202 [Suillus clintonianus]|uniref:uncharacterized protein n=1 Tax=Suillus clintonianus TaxID=1904413 RepID=UPI001B88570C|nr:uncharacterized protein DEU56DRAFT_870202 [Suillus clintonianus]KAG2145926.1 hypothetical protein DEU56DRAFT_870202 [Suillus clintonianus]
MSRREKCAKAKTETLHKRVREAEAECRQQTAKADASVMRISTLEKRNGELTKRTKALSMRAARVPGQKVRAVENAVNKLVVSCTISEPTLKLKEGGVITDAARDMVRDLVAIHNLPVSSVNGAIATMSSVIGVDLEGTISEWSIGWIMKEASVAAQVQLVDEITQVEGITLSSDGTTHKNINYQSHHLTYSSPDGEGVTRFAGILHEVNHTSETHDEMYAAYNECMDHSQDPREFAAKSKGMLTDHVEDQKKLVRLFMEWKRTCEREVRGERALASLPLDDITRIIDHMMECIIAAAGGVNGWDALSLDEQHRRTKAAHQQLHVHVGEQHFASLTDAEKEAVDFFVWAGCCMHKELNAVKGGNARMTAWWVKNGIEGPILLMNKDNAATAASGGNTAAVSRAVQVSGHGAVKALDLTGGVFRHKDDKKGQQDAFRYYMEDQLGYFSAWPDTSNTHYQSNCDGASQWLVHRPLFIPYLELMLHHKESRTHTNMERNVYMALFCQKMAEEMTAFSTWGNCIGHPYMRQIRGALRTFSNILDLRPLHDNLIIHVKMLIVNIDLVIGPDATYQTATLDVKPFERPEAFYVVHRMAQDTKTYPHLRQLLIKFLEGALKTLLRFCAKFAPDSIIAKSTAPQRELARMETTNDANEGALGTLRITLRHAPRERKRRRAQVEYDRKLIEKNHEIDKRRKERRDAATAKLDAVVPCLVDADLAKMRVADIVLQLRWHHMPKRKEDKLKVLREAIAHYTSGEVTHRETTQEVPLETGESEDEDEPWTIQPMTHILRPMTHDESFSLVSCL